MGETTAVAMDGRTSIFIVLAKRVVRHSKSSTVDLDDLQKDRWKIALGSRKSRYVGQSFVLGTLSIGWTVWLAVEKKEAAEKSIPEPWESIVSRRRKEKHPR